MSLQNMALRPLDSDAPNADAQLQVVFYLYKGEGMWDGKPHVRIIVPGDKDNIIDRPASEYDKARFHRQWLFFQADNTKDQVVGVPLSQWRAERPEELTEGQLQELLILKFLSVEQVAMASDAQVQRVGMGAAGLRERARSYLNSKNAQASGAELANLKAENAAMKEMMAQILANQLAQTAAPAPAAAAAVPKKKPSGWAHDKRNKKAKKDKSEDVQHTDAPAGAAGL